MRLAVAWGIDRQALAEAAGGATAIPTSRLAAPGQSVRIGVSDGFPLRPELTRARGFDGGHRVTAVLAVITDEAGAIYDRPLLDRLREELSAVGIAVKVMPIRQRIAADQPGEFQALLARADLALAGATAEQSSDPVAYLRHLGEEYLPPTDRARLEQIARLASPRREAAAAELTGRIESEAVYIQYLDRATPELVSARLGCVFDQPEYPGVDLAALCLS
jgi:hypothetical protein